jgi:4-amino-4-deoxy-L-arabinose transferase-like glycosyltransferase
MTTAESRSRGWAWAGLAAVLAGGLGLRLWGIGQGLPYAYNADEADHFVPHAVDMFAEGTLNPHYFANPPAYTYVLHYLFALAYGGASGVQHAFDAHPADVYTLARVAAAVLGTIALWLLYTTGARLFGRAVGLLAAAIEAVAFLPVFYAHLALNDVPTLAPATLSLLGAAGVLRTGRPREYLLAGVGLGLACASKYTAGIVLLPFLAAAAARYLQDAATESRSRPPARPPARAAAVQIASKSLCSRKGRRGERRCPG